MITRVSGGATQTAWVTYWKFKIGRETEKTNLLVKSKVKISSNLVAFSKNTNFMYDKNSELTKKVMTNSLSFSVSLIFYEEVKDINICHALHTLQKMYTTEVEVVGGASSIRRTRNEQRPRSSQVFSFLLFTTQSISMTQLLTHSVAHSTEPSSRPKTNNQSIKKFLSLAVSCVKVVKNWLSF